MALRVPAKVSAKAQKWAWGLALGLAFGATGACFNGADASGLPCTEDADCGEGQSCEAGFCGGAPDATCGNGILEEPEECDDGEANANEAACKADCTINVCGDGHVGPDEACDDGNDLSGDGCSATCVVEMCGDGKVDEGEECDEGADNDNEGSCTEMCTEAVCGDGFVQEGEACDDMGESATCNADCSAAMCGDGIVNMSAGEACEPENMMSSADCMTNCNPPLLWEDVEGDTSAWSLDNVVNGSLDSGWSVTVEESNSGQRSFHTGLPPNGPASWRLIGPELDLSGLPEGETVTLEIQHWYDFDDCGSQDQESDGAIVEVIDANDAVTVVAPVGGYVEVLDNASGCGAGQENPLEGESAFSHSNGSFSLEVFDLSDFVGQTIRPSFHVAWDCGECMDGQNFGWYVDDIVVYRGTL
jgi:cysteine-rich repeat protein